MNCTAGSSSKSVNVQLSIDLKTGYMLYFAFDISKLVIYKDSTPQTGPDDRVTCSVVTCEDATLHTMHIRIMLLHYLRLHQRQTLPLPLHPRITHPQTLVQHLPLRHIPNPDISFIPLPSLTIITKPTISRQKHHACLRLQPLTKLDCLDRPPLPHKPHKRRRPSHRPRPLSPAQRRPAVHITAQYLEIPRCELHVAVKQGGHTLRTQSKCGDGLIGDGDADVCVVTCSGAEFEERARPSGEPANADAGEGVGFGEGAGGDEVWVGGVSVKDGGWWRSTR